MVIELCSPDTASEVLGGYSCPTSRGDKQLSHMVKKGKKWVGKVCKRMLPPKDVWHSFTTQAIPSFSYGLGPLMSSPSEVEKAFMDLYYHCLSPLGVNKCIARGICSRQILWTRSAQHVIRKA